MRKIPTLFVRDPENMARVTDQVHPDCRWVLDGEGVATRKYDGTCVMLDESGKWWARREVKPGKQPPPGWVEADHDETTGKRPGWEPVESSPFAKFHAEALRTVDGLSDTGDATPVHYAPGTYELCGPKVQGNPEGFTLHCLVRHEDAVEASWLSKPRPDFEWFSYEMRSLAARGWEGIVWHHPDGRMAKLKGRDFPHPTPSPESHHGG